MHGSDRDAQQQRGDEQDQVNQLICIVILKIRTPQIYRVAQMISPQLQFLDPQASLLNFVHVVHNLFHPFSLLGPNLSDASRGALPEGRIQKQWKQLCGTLVQVNRES